MAMPRSMALSVRWLPVAHHELWRLGGCDPVMAHAVEADSLHIYATDVSRVGSSVRRYYD